MADQDDEEKTCARCRTAVHVKWDASWDQGVDMCHDCTYQRRHELEAELVAANAKIAQLEEHLKEAGCESAALLGATKAGYDMLNEHLRQTMDAYPEWRTGLRAMQAALGSPLKVARAFRQALSDAERLVREHEASISEWKTALNTSNSIMADEIERRVAGAKLVEAARHAFRTHGCGSRCLWLRRGLDTYDEDIKDIDTRNRRKEHT